MELDTRFFKTIESHISKGYYIKNTKNSTNLFTHDPEEYEKYKLTLEEEATCFHTYTPRDEKPHSFVVKDRDSCLDLAEIENDLKTKYNLDVKKIFKINTPGKGMYVCDSH